MVEDYMFLKAVLLCTMIGIVCLPVPYLLPDASTKTGNCL